MLPKERDSENPKIIRTHVCAWQISYNFLLKLGQEGSFARNIPLDTSHSDDRQHKNESAVSSSGLSSGDSDASVAPLAGQGMGILSSSLSCKPGQK